MNVGDKVVCVDDSINPKVNMDMFPNWVKEGQTYTIRRKEGSLTGSTRILVEELRNKVGYNPELGGSVEAGFAQRRFVPWDEYILSNSIGEEVEFDEEKETEVEQEKEMS